MSELIRDLKNLFHNYIFYREEDDAEFHQRINENVVYKDGCFVDRTTIKQKIKFTRDDVHLRYNAYWLGALKVEVSPPLNGQQVTFFITQEPYTNTSTNSNGLAWSNSVRYERNAYVFVHVNSVNINGVYYTGGTLGMNIETGETEETVL